MTEGLSDADIDEIEQRVTTALEVAPQPWAMFLETRHGIGGSSVVRTGDDPGLDHELTVDVRAGDDRWTSPDARLDAVLDLLGHAPHDLQRLLREVRRLRTRQA